MKKRSRLAKETGSATLVEMCFVFPIVIMVVFTLLYMGLYFLQGTVVNNYAQRAAVYVSRLVTMPGYDAFGELTNSNDFSNIKTDTATIENVTSEHNPYRFWTSGVNMVENKHEKVEDDLEKLLGTSSFIGGRNMTCDIDVTNSFIFQTVTVTVTQTIETPFFMQYLGIGSELKLTTSAQAAATCPTEFVRNVDLVYDLVNILLEKLNLGSLDAAVTKITGWKEKFGM